jgi:hypothetical protein
MITYLEYLQVKEQLREMSVMEPSVIIDGVLAVEEPTEMADVMARMAEIKNLISDELKRYHERASSKVVDQVILESEAPESENDTRGAGSEVELAQM